MFRPLAYQSSGGAVTESSRAAVQDSDSSKPETVRSELPTESQEITPPGPELPTVASALPGEQPKLEIPIPKPLVHIAIFASGAGSNARQIINHFKGSAIATVSLVLCNKEGAGVLTIAEQENIPSILIDRKRFFQGDGYLPELQNRKIGFIALAGFLWKVPDALIAAFPKRIVNIHPALLPKFGGKGMYGSHVHETVLWAKEKESGITIHFVDEQYDNGDIILQVACPVLDNDTPDSLARRIHALEHIHYPQVIETLLQNPPDNELRVKG